MRNIPKFMLCAIAIGAIGFANTPASAATQHVAVSVCLTPDRGASLLSNPEPQVPEDVGTRGTTVMRIDLSPLGQIDALAVAQSSGDPRLDFEAMRVVRASRYAAASHNCNPVSDRVLYAVTFSN